ncbi:Phthiocerol/phthiodiolone dimycocerosyl transferase OS=Tsukamurella paurometabola (strain ATCC 8368/ DSM / CCUG 35730 / CIP 100753 / JCM 10117 / KCTC 9821/ NBRC 16120 / NCIMB 702349 / NCTC 13040) OX=521096 GN=Tpau_1036 PE=3 SV=1 [Tsukamurella paurometabola]|uniref:Phthiocerol/phthiodiolone dimycocerosyl transferase n=1 Tax=Tsukamurella paurometabola (strain ATCC 8368 / DSM 20162 / CCUG 35730 / CIP 100753 / JCM 10117 / KCTC 9821 / NBRC 16120 / NCIMB 702349 / NCTC 13040) TaxID=521096 RepID=D5UV79_TSUPD|nr:acyltransferase [Tsukamurella paurometabola]ADG77669.1 acyltransferase PapA5 [Tsukamurella paurometabola DSM 20162]SUP28217.1 Phthiocerol/phthiodiolone dimycocerosyl transferase [Tsukamurella paurometabola]
MARRALTPLEVPYVVTNTTSSGSFLARGPIDAARLARAYAALRREYPELTGRIEATAFGFDLVTPDVPVDEDAAPILVEERAFVAGDVALGVQPDTGISAVQLVSDGDLHRVTLGVNHAVADGAHALFLNLRLWQLYTDPSSFAGPVTELPAAPLDLAGRLGDVSGAPRFTAAAVESAGVVPTAATVDGGAFGFDRIQIDAAATDALRRRAKAAGLSVHGLLAGLIVTAERAELDRPAEEAVSMAVFSPVDLRGRCDPPVEAAAVTNFAGSSTAPVAVRGDAVPEEIGRIVLDRLKSDLADGTVAAALTGAAGVQVTGGAPVRLSNIGAIPEPATPEGVEVLDFHTSSEVDIERVRALVHSAPPEALAPLVGLHYHALTFGGRLSIELRYAPGTLTDEAVRRIRSRIETALTEPVGAAA